MGRGNSREPAPREGSRRNTPLQIRPASLPPEVLAAVEAAPNRSALVREALIRYVRAGPEREALARIETMLRDISARLAALEAGGVVAAPAQAVQEAPGDAARAAAQALAAWCDGD